MKNILLSLALASATISAAAQGTHTIQGTVTDENGEPLIGAAVKVGKTGVITDIDGKYSIQVPASTATVEYSYVGMKTEVRKVKSDKMDVVLKSDAKVMDELVVIGYGSVKKGDITNAVAKVKGDQLKDRPVSNVASALQGELAGVEVRTTSGAPGSGVQINVRGATSINESGNSNPLIVVDGVPMDEDFDLVNLNAQDIESIEVLKDASSSAIYGSRGANGVIIITSKKGNDDGKIRVNFSADFSLSTPERYLDIMTPEEWIAWRKKANNVRYVNQYGAKGAKETDSYAERLAIIGSNSTNYMNDPRWDMPNYGGLALIDWQKEIFQTSFAQNYNVSLSAGNKKSNYRASLGYVNQDGIVVNTGFQRINLKLSAQTTIKDKLTLGVDIAPQYTVTTGGNVDGKDNVAQQALTLAPVAEADAGVYTGAQPYNRYLWASSTTSPIAYMDYLSYRDEKVRINTSAFARYQILPELTAEVLGSWLFSNSARNRFIPSSLNRYWASYPEGYYSSSQWKGSRSHKYLLQATATYNKDFGKHHLNVVGGWSLESTTDGSTYTIEASQFPNNSLNGGFSDMTTVTLTDVEAVYSTEDRLISYFCRAEYGYDSRYLFNASLRRDGSSRFGANKKWGTFPAVSGAWRASNEKFWNPNWAVNQAKLRVSFGVNGSNSIPVNSAYGLLGNSNYSQDGSLITGFVPTSTANDDLGWQKTDSWNFGVDLGFFDNRISLALDYYVKNIRDMLYQITLPADMGYTKGYTNVGNIRNQGIELELKTENLTGKLRWTTNFQFSWNKNEVIDLGSNSTIFTGYDNSTQVIQVGHAAGEYYLYYAEGVYETAEDLKRYPTQTGSVVGSVRYRDVSGPNGVPDGKITEDDRVYMGHPQPSCTYGLTNTFKYKNWTASFLITAQTGGKIYGALGRAFDRQGMGTSVNVLSKWSNMWFSESDPGDGHTPCAWVSGINEEYDSRWLYSSDFIKLKNITVSYNWRMPKKSFVDAIRLSASVENVFMIDGYDGGYSPESNNSSSRISSYDYGAYPMARTFNFGVNMQF